MFSVVTTTRCSTRSSREGNTNVSSLIKQYFLAISDAVSNLSLVSKEEKVTKCSLDKMVWNNALKNIGCKQVISIYLVQLRSIMVCYFGFTLEKLVASEKLLSADHNRWTEAKCRAYIAQKLRVGGCDSINQLIIFFVERIDMR